MSQSNECTTFAEGIAHPNEKILAKEILEGKVMGEFSLGFDQVQVDAMTEKLKGAGCFQVEEEAPAEEVEETEDSETVDGSDDDASDTDEASDTTEDASDSADASEGDADAEKEAEASNSPDEQAQPEEAVDPTNGQTAQEGEGQLIQA